MERPCLGLEIEGHCWVEMLPAFKNTPSTVRGRNHSQLVQGTIRPDSSFTARRPQLVADIKTFSLWRNQCLCYVDIVSFSVGETGDDVDFVGLRGRYQSIPLRAVQSKFWT